jgi:hypothetical protein
VFLVFWTLGCSGNTDTDTEDTDTGPSDPRVEGVVDIYLAAGEHQSDKSCYEATSLHSSTGNCSIYRLTVDVGEWAVLEHEAIAQPTDSLTAVWQPALNPSGTELAFTKSMPGEVVVNRKSIASGDSADLGSPVTVNTAGFGAWTWPSWATDDQMVVQKTDLMVACREGDTTTGFCEGYAGRWGNIYAVDLDKTATESATAITGYQGAQYGFALNAPSACPKEGQSHIVAAHGAYNHVDIDTYPLCDGGNLANAVPCDDIHAEPMPTVYDTQTDDFWQVQLRSAHPDVVAAAGQPVDLTGCAHLAWNPAGTRLMCSEQGTMAIKQASCDLQNQIYAFDFDPTAIPARSVAVVEEEPLFKHKTPVEIWGEAVGAQCDVFHHKYAQWCGHEDLLVASIVCLAYANPETGTEADCTSSLTDAQLLGQHVYLIDISDPDAPEYMDLTNELEAALGVDSGTMSSFTATCGDVVE